MLEIHFFATEVVAFVLKSVFLLFELVETFVVFINVCSENEAEFKVLSIQTLKRYVPMLNV